MRRAWHERDDGRLATLAEDPQRAMPAIEAEIADVGVACLAHPQPVQPEQDRERGALVSEVFGGEQEPAELCAVHPVSLAGVHLRSPDVLGGVRCDPTVDVREPVQPTHRRQAPIDRRCCEPALFHVMTEQFDVRAPRCEHLEADRLRPGEEVAEIVPIRLQRAAVVAGEERHRGQLGLIDIAYDENLIKPNPIR